MALITINVLIAKAVDSKDAKLAGQIADILRNEGCTYNDILKRVQKIRPYMNSDDWEALMYEADEGASNDD